MTTLIHHGDTETRSKLILEDLTQEIIGACIEVHKELGPGLLESVYEECLCHELHLRNLAFLRQVPVPVRYKGITLQSELAIDLIVEDAVILELKSVERIIPVHEAQLLTYMRLMGKKVGFVVNFNVPVLTRGLRRRVL